MARVLFMPLAFMFIGFSQVLGSIASRPRGVATSTFGNSSFVGTFSPPTPRACCFLVQDTVSEVWWQITSYSSTLSTVNLTSISTLITKFPNTTSTNYETNVYPTGVSSTWTYRVGANPIAIEPNYGTGPSEVEHILDGTAPITTGGTAVPSPAAFYVYNSVKIITASPVTDQRGNIACGTTSEYNEWNANQFFSYRTYTLSDINSNAEAYFDRSDIADPLIPSVTSTTQNEVVISLETPFIYLPSRGARGFRGDTTSCHQTGGTENYGYVPRTLLDFLIGNPAYSSQYPGLESCLPGGPSIFQSAPCADAMSSTLEIVSDLTSTTVIYVTPPVLEGATKSDISDMQVMVHASGIDDEGDVPMTGLSTPTPRPMPPPVKSQTQKGSPQPLPSILRPTPLPTSIRAPVPIISSAGPSPLPASKFLPAPLPAFASLGQIINSIIGGRPASPTSPNPPPIVIPAATTIPIADVPFYPGLVGVTSTINGNPVVIIPEPTTLASPVQPQNGIVISEATTIPIAELPFFPGLAGSTETINVAAVVVVSKPTTLVPPSIQSLSAAVTNSANPALVASGVQDDEQTITEIGTGTTDIIVIRPTTIPFNPDLPVMGGTIISSGETYVVVSTTVTVENQTPTSTLLSSGSITDTSIVNTQGVAVSATSSKSAAVPQPKNQLWRYVLMECGVLVGFLGIFIT